MDKNNFNILIVHYNTPKLTECLVKSINKFVGTDCHVYIFDNSDKKPFTYKQSNLTILDNTHGEIINFDKWLEKYPQRFQTKAKMNNFGSAKHAYTIEKCFDLIPGNFVLMDSDILLKQDISKFVNDNYVSCGEIFKTTVVKSRVLPFICYINVELCKKYGIHFFDEKRMNGLYAGKYPESYDTGASFLEDITKTKAPFLTIKLDSYIEHFKAGSWLSESNALHKAKRTEEEWLETNKKYYFNSDIVVSLTTHGERVKHIQPALKSLLKQTIKPYKIVVTLSDADYAKIPSNIISFMNEHKIETITCEKDLGPHTKYYFAMQKYRNNPIVTVDDDIVYDNNLLELLLKGYNKFPNCVSANRVHKIKYNTDGTPIDYMKWQIQYKDEYMKPSFDLFATGVGGVLYPPNILDIDGVLREDIDKSFFADDVYLKWRENELGVQVVYTGNGKSLNGKEVSNAAVKSSGLALVNNLKNRNDVYIEQLGLRKKIVKNKRVIYTCITGNYEALVPLTNRQSDFDYVCFTDNSGLTSDFWELRPVPQELLKLSCVKQQRIIKICPHRYLPDYDESIWIDGAVDVLSDPNKFIEKFCSDSNKSVFIRKHPSRNCIYTEGLTCIKLRKDKAVIVNPQLDKYRKENFPRNFGLAETNIIYRKHKNPYCVKLMDLWAIELLNGSHRDQLSFNYALWKTGSDGFKYLETNLVRGTYFKWYSSHNRRAITSSEKKKSVSIPVSSNLSVAKKNQGKKTVIVNNRTRRYAPIQTSKKNEKRVTVSSKRYGTSKNIAAQQISRVFGIPLHGSKSSYEPIKVETVRNTVKFKTVKQVNIVERKVIDAPKQTKVKFKPTVRNNWKKFETSNTPKQIKITSKPIVKPNIQKNKTGETPKPMPRVNPIVFKTPTDLVMSGLCGRYVPPVEIKVQKKVEKSKKTTPVVTQTNETTKSKPVNITVSSPTKVKENKQSQVILKQGTRVLSRRVDNISKKKIEMNNKRKMSKKGGFFR